LLGPGEEGTVKLDKIQAGKLAQAEYDVGLALSPTKDTDKMEQNLMSQIHNCRMSSIITLVMGM